jgi:hypothetical protein
MWARRAWLVMVMGWRPCWIAASLCNASSAFLICLVVGVLVAWRLVGTVVGFGCRCRGIAGPSVV